MAETLLQILLFLSIINNTVLLNLMNFEQPLVKVNLLTAVHLAHICLEFVKVLIKIIKFLSILALFKAIHTFEGFDFLFSHSLGIHFNDRRNLAARNPFLDPYIRLLGVNIGLRIWMKDPSCGPFLYLNRLIKLYKSLFYTVL